MSDSMWLEIEANWVAAGVVLRRGTKGSLLAADFSPAAVVESFDWETLVILPASAPKLRELQLNDSPAKAQTLIQVVAGLPEMVELSLVGTAANDELLEVLVPLQKLKLLDVTGSQVTHSALAEYRKRLIRTRILCRDE